MADLDDLVQRKLEPEAFFAENYITEGMKILLTESRSSDSCAAFPAKAKSRWKRGTLLFRQGNSFRITLRKRKRPSIATKFSRNRAVL